MFRWFFFCDTGAKAVRGFERRLRDDPCDQRRLLCWAVLCTFLWAHLPLTLLNCVLFVVFTVVFSLAVSLATRDHQAPIEMLTGACYLALVTAIISAAYTVTVHPLFLRYEVVLRKLVMKEYELWRHWCTNTYITLVSITIISCVIKGFHKRLGL